MARTELLPLIDDIYETALRPRVWDRLLDTLCQRLEATSAAVVTRDLITRQARLGAVVRFDPSLAEPFEQYYSSRAPFPKQIAPDRVALSWRDTVPVEEFQRTEFYDGFLRPQDDTLFLAMVPLSFADQALAGLSVQRSRRRGPFDDDELAVLEALGPHLRRATALRRRIGSLEGERHLLGDALQELGQAAFLLDRDQRVVFLNALAERLVQAGDAVRLRSDARLSVSSADAERALEQLLAQAVGQTTSLPTSGGTLFLPRPDARPLAAVVSRLPPSFFLEAGAPAVALFVADPEASQPAQVESLCGLYGLTEAEARLAARLAAGMSLQEISSATGTSVHTLRTQLKQALAKTDTHRQAELVSLVLRLRLPVGVR